MQHTAAWISLLPPLLAIATGWRITAAGRTLIAWCLLLALENALSLSLAVRGSNNLWLGYLFQPITGAVVLWAFALLQPDSTSRFALRYAIPLFVLVHVGLTLGIEDRQTFSLVASPFHNIVLLLVALGTFVRLSLLVEEPLGRQDWFWFSGGFMLLAATDTATGPLAWYFLRGRWDLLHLLLNVRAAAYIAAFVAITWGILCQTLPNLSGGSSSPRSSRSSSSSVGSA